jgi:hypothetical protein
VITVDKALLELVPGTRWVLKGNSYSGLNWLDTEIDKPTESEIQAKIAELEAAEPMRLLRIERDRLIQQTDWWVLPDRTATPAQLAYRQALRDLPANSTPALDENGNLTGVEWPVYSEEA